MSFFETVCGNILSMGITTLFIVGAAIQLLGRIPCWVRFSGNQVCFRGNIVEGKSCSSMSRSSGTCCFGYAYMKTGNIWVPTILHFFNNNLVLVVSGQYSADVLAILAKS